MTDNKPLKVNRGGGKFGGRMGAADQEKKDEIVEKVIIIKRVSKVVKGGKRFSFSAMVVAGDEKGRMGVGFGKGVEVSSAIKKALTKAKKDFFEIQLKGSTIPHEILGRCGAAVVLLKPAAEGTGVIAGGPVRAVCDVVGIRDILTKCLKSNNPINVVKATVDGLKRVRLARISHGETKKADADNETK